VACTESASLDTLLSLNSVCTTCVRGQREHLEAGGRELATERAFDEVRQGVLLGLARAVGDLASKALDILRGVEGSEVPKEALEVVAADAER